MELKGLTIAHRGIHNENIPENSIKSFKKALEKKVAIELDVHLLKDGNIVVFHDFNLKRMTGFDGIIENMTIEEISKLRLLDTDEKIPLLVDVLKMIDSKVPIIIEVKNLKVGPLEKELVKILDQYSNFCIQSFSVKTMFWFKFHRPKYLIGLLVSSKRKNKYNIFVPVDFISHSLLGIQNKMILKLRKKGLPIMVWTIKDEIDLVKAKQYGDSYIIDMKS